MNILDRTIGLFAPDICVGCGLEGAPICAECTERLPKIDTAICYDCGKLSRNFKTCDKCLSKNKPQYVYISCEYRGLAKDFVKEYKFSYVRRAAKIIAQQIHETLPYYSEMPLICFVPTASAHIRERGFDHASQITKELCKLRNWNYLPLINRVSNKQQHGASKNQRVKQIKGAFRVSLPEFVNKKHVLLIDDISTTGATLSECAKVLIEAGATRVDAAVFARTPEK